MATIDIKYDCQPYDGTPGKPFDDFEERLLNVAAGRADERGWSLADALTRLDEGGALGPPLPGGAGAAKAAAAFRKRQKESYGLVTKHQLDPDHVSHMRLNHFQQGPDAWDYLVNSCRTPVDALQLRQMDLDWNALDILQDVGVDENTVLNIAKKMKSLNSKRPLASRFNQTKQAERLLELIFSCSKHFSQSALIEYNAAPAQWQFVIAGGAAAGQRDFGNLTAHYHSLWKAAVAAKMPGFHKRAPASRPPAPVRTTLESGLVTSEVGNRIAGAEREFGFAGSTDYIVPRAGSPSRTLALLASAGDELADKHGTMTTTDWTLLSAEETACAACDGGVDGEFEVVYIFDADDTASIEVICDNCFGFGHLRRACPSNRNRKRSVKYAIAGLEMRLAKLGDKEARRPPGRGQRAPFRDQPRRFAPARRSDGQRVTPQVPRGRNGTQRRLYAAEEGSESGSEVPSSAGLSSAFKSSESSNVATESMGLLSERQQQPRGSQTKSASMPMTFSDDALFEAERMSAPPREQGKACSESAPPSKPTVPEKPPGLTPRVPLVVEQLKPPSTGTPIPLLLLCSISAAVGAVFAAVLEGIERTCAIGGVAVLTIMLALVGRTHAAPAVAFSPTSAGIEYALPNMEEGMISLASGLKATIDSGCTSTSIPVQRRSMVKRIIDDSPNQKIWIADDKGLDIVAIAEMDVEIPAIDLIPEAGVEPRNWKSVASSATISSSRTLIVDGLGKDTILFSVKGLKRDGYLTFLNDDNSVQREDCLLVKGTHTVIPFATSYAYQIPLGCVESAGAASDGLEPADVTSNRTVGFPSRGRSAKAPSLFHRGLGHPGERRMKSSNISIDGILVSDLEHDPSTCSGCRLGGSGKHHFRHRGQATAPHGSARSGFDHFGQQVDSDICTGFKPSFPHQFTSMINFNDRYSAEKWVCFLRAGDQGEITDSLKWFTHEVGHRLRDKQVGRWTVDNSKSFLGEEVQDAAAEMVRQRGYAVPNDSNSLPVPERTWGVWERMMRCMHADAIDPTIPGDIGAPECLWPWSAHQSCLLSYYLATASHTPPMSPYQFSSGDASMQDLSWARVMFCDVTVSLPKADVNGKIAEHSADGCHLGYDHRRKCHYVFVEKLQRLSSFTVREWREGSFTMCKRISSDTPVEYFEGHDLPFSSVTSTLVKHRYTARRREAGAVVSGGFRILVIFHRERPESMIEYMRRDPNVAEVKSIDVLNGGDQDLLVESARNDVLDMLSKYSFVFMCPPCITACIAYVPALRTFPDFVWGANGLFPKQQKLVDDHNILYSFCVEVIRACNASRTPWALEGPAARRRDDVANWPKFHRNAFIWDIPDIAGMLESGDAIYHCTAQCPWGAPWQKYTGLATSSGQAARAFHYIFENGVCSCKRHSQVLQGYDTDGVAHTSKSADYWPRFGQALATACIDSCRSDDACQSCQEGELGHKNSAWHDRLTRLDQEEFLQRAAQSMAEPESPGAPVTHGITRAELNELHSNAHREDLDVPPEVEIWLADAEGAWPADAEGAWLSRVGDEYMERVLAAKGSLRVSEIGSDLAKIKTVAEAQASSHWPMFKAAMEDEIHGKFAGAAAWSVVLRPADGTQVHKSRWVFAIKLNDDNSIREIKARFVACGYTQMKGRDFESVFAATMPGVTLRVLCALINEEDLETDHIDAKKAFTQADIDFEVFVEMPEGFEVKGHVLLLHKALEGIKQGAHLWFELNRGAWLKLGAKSWLNETNLYYHEAMGLRVGVFADDTLAAYPIEELYAYKRIKKEYAKLIKIGTQDEITPAVKFTGVQLERNRKLHQLKIHQERYIEQMAESMKGLIVKQDMPHGGAKKERDTFDQMLDDKTSPSIDKTELLKVMGKLVWPVSMTRVDAAMETSVICSCVSDPRQVHLDAAYVVAGYLWSTKSLGITYGGKLAIPYGLSEMPHGFEESNGLYTAHDSSWGKRAHPLGGYIVMYQNGAVDWSAKLVKIVPDSSCEAETAVGSLAAKGTCFIRGLLAFHRKPTKAPTPMLGDNEAMHSLVTQEGASVRTRYYERATMLIKRAVMMLILAPLLVNTRFMIADMLTKALEKSSFIRFRNVAMNVHCSMREILDAAVQTVHGDVRKTLDRLRRHL